MSALAAGVVVAVVLVAASAFGLWRRARDGRLREALALDGEYLTPSDIGVPLGSRVTFVQFSTAFCAPCRTARAVLADVARDHDDVVHVDIDAETHLDLVRRLGVMRTPTVLVLDGQGRVLQRATGAPRKAEVLAVVDAVPTQRAI